MKYISHTLIAALIMTMLVIGVGFNAFAAASVATAYFVGREIAQAEYRWIEHWGDGQRANFHVSYLFDKRVWTADSLFFDMLLPSLLCFGAATLMLLVKS